MSYDPTFTKNLQSAQSAHLVALGEQLRGEIHKVLNEVLKDSANEYKAEIDETLLQTLPPKTYKCLCGADIYYDYRRYLHMDTNDIFCISGRLAMPEPEGIDTKLEIREKLRGAERQVHARINKIPRHRDDFRINTVAESIRNIFKDAMPYPLTRCLHCGELVYLDDDQRFYLHVKGHGLYCRTQPERQHPQDEHNRATPQPY